MTIELDIVGRLRETAYLLTIPHDEDLMNEAADEIARLREKIEILEAELRVTKKIAEHYFATQRQPSDMLKFSPSQPEAER